MLYRLLIVAATIIWGSSFVVVKDVITYLPTGWVLTLRFLTAALILAVVFIKRRALFLKREYVGVGLLFGVALFVAYYLQTWGLAYTTPGKNAFLTGVYCVIVPFLAWFVTRKAPTRFNLVAAFTCVVGVGFVSLGSVTGLNVGDVLTLGCAVFFAVHIMLVSRLSAGRDIYVLTMWQFAGVGACSLVVALGTGQPAPNLAAFSGEQWAALGYLTVFVTTLALLFQNMGLEHLPPASASLLLSLESPFGVAFSVALGTEALTGKMLLGFALIFAAVLISEVLPAKLAERAAGE